MVDQHRTGADQVIAGADRLHVHLALRRAMMDRGDQLGIQPRYDEALPRTHVLDCIGEVAGRPFPFSYSCVADAQAAPLAEPDGESKNPMCISDESMDKPWSSMRSYSH